MSQVAGMAQWQSNGFVNRGLWVRLPLPAPVTFARVTDMLTIFGRETPVELTLDQVSAIS